MNNESNLNEKSYEDLAIMLVTQPERASEIFDTNPDLLFLRRELGFLWNIMDIYLSLSNPPTPHEMEIYDPLIEHVKEMKITTLAEVENAEHAIDSYLQNVLGFKDWEEYEEERESLFAYLEELISYGIKPDELRAVCKEEKPKIRLPFDEEELKEKYLESGYEYNPEDGSVSKTKLTRLEIQNRLLEMQESRNKRLKEAAAKEAAAKEQKKR